MSNQYRHLDGSLGDEEKLPVELRGTEAFYLENEADFTTTQGYAGQRAFGHGRGWVGPGWYVKIGGWSRCGRCHDASCGHHYTELVPMTSVESDLTEHLKELVKRLRSVRKLLGPRCGYCSTWGGQHESYCTEDKRHGVCGDCGGWDNEHEPHCIEKNGQ